MFLIIPFLRRLPHWVWKLAAMLLLILIVEKWGEHRIQAKWDASKLTQQTQVETAIKDQTIATSVVETKEQAKEAEIRTVFKDRVIYKIKEVPYEVIIKEDAGCTIPPRFTSMWNSANSGEVPTTSIESDARAGTTREAEGWR